MSLLTQFYDCGGGFPWENSATEGTPYAVYVLDSGEVVSMNTTSFGFTGSNLVSAGFFGINGTTANLAVEEVYSRGVYVSPGGAAVTANSSVKKMVVSGFYYASASPGSLAFAAGSQLEELFIGTWWTQGAGAVTPCVLDLTNCSSLTKLTIKGIYGDLSNIVPTVNAQGCALDQASVDGIISTFAWICQRYGAVPAFTLDLSLGTNATPSAWASALVPIITGAGGTVSTN